MKGIKIHAFAHQSLMYCINYGFSFFKKLRHPWGTRF